MAPRSRTGCLTCRQRKLKCSEERPVCAQCMKANRECIPSSGITFRHQQNPSMNAADHGEGSLKSFYGYKETFGKGTVWVDVPRELTFVHTSNPYEDEEEGQYAVDGDTTFMTDASVRYDDSGADAYQQLAQAAYPQYATHGLEALSAVASQDQYSYAPPPAPMNHHDSATQQRQSTSPQNQHATASSNLDFILNPSSNSAMSSGNIDPRLHSATPVSQSAQTQPPHTNSEHVRTHSYSSSYGGRPSLPSLQGSNASLDRRTAIESPDLIFLLRDFSERAGYWMDIFDLNSFFVTTVPVLAVKCPLLLYSCVALSAKNQARVDGRKPVMNGQITPTRQSSMEKWPGPPMSAEDWYHRAREYYDLAVSLLRQALAGASRPPTSSLPEDATPTTIQMAQIYPLPTTDSDELNAATSALCVYEFLDASGPEWSRHLDGAKSLFDIANDRMLHMTLPPSPVSVVHQAAHHLSESLDTPLEPPRRSLNPGRRAVFWCFARQDMLSAFINNSSTRVDTSDIAMWRSAGLKLTPEGYVCPSNPQHPEYVLENAMSDDLICNAFVWLLCKLVNFVAAGDDLPETMSPLGLGVGQKELLDYWEELDAQLTAWYEGLPTSFQATAARPADGEHLIEEKWFPRPMCASTMQWWHFARIQLLHNKPHLTTANPFPRSRAALGSAAPGTSLAARHASYTSILQQSRDHAKEIVAISLGRSNEPARVHSVQPLWTAGLVLGIAEEGQANDETVSMWRRCILSQLRGIERDMGWATDYRVRQLLDVWQLPLDWGLDEKPAGWERIYG